jgi:hypothetical protein
MGHVTHLPFSYLNAQFNPVNGTACRTLQVLERRPVISCMRALLLAVAFSLLSLPSSASACSWPTKSDLDTTNVAFPDEAATYWVTRYEGVPGAEIVIRGRYPDARYFSFHIYDEALRPIAAVADFETTPDGSGGYTTGFTFDAPQSGALIYRVYVSGVPGDPAGGVPLPEISLKVSGREEELALGQCEPVPPSTGGAVNDAVKRSNYPADGPRGFEVGTTDPPTTTRFYRLVPGTNGGFWSNMHIAYLTTRFARRDDGRELLIYRFKAPTAPGQVRYWSVCQNETATQRFVECLADYEAVVDEAGFVTVVISDPEEKPANAPNWLPWGGPYYDGLVIYRHMLPAPDFAEAIQNVPEGTPAADVMGEYFPEVAYCSKETFEAGGAAACLE